MMHFIGKCDGPIIEAFIKERKSAWEENWPHWVDLKLQGDVAIWWKSHDYKEMMTLSNGEFEKILLDKWSHRKIRIQREPRVYFHVTNIYYRFMVVFIKKMSLFLLTLVACIILSMFSWLINYKF
jgi:hypothetical protein